MLAIKNLALVSASTMFAISYLENVTLQNVLLPVYCTGGRALCNLYLIR